MYCVGIVCEIFPFKCLCCSVRVNRRIHTSMQQQVINQSYFCSANKTPSVTREYANMPTQGIIFVNFILRYNIQTTLVPSKFRLAGMFFTSFIGMKFLCPSWYCSLNNSKDFCPSKETASTVHTWAPYYLQHTSHVHELTSCKACSQQNIIKPRFTLVSILVL